MARRRELTVGGFDFTHHIRELTVDIVARVPQLNHIDMKRVAVSFSQARKRVLYGLQASLTPLRFEGGARAGRHRGRLVSVQEVRDESGREMLYILTFYLPRFLDLDLSEKLTTIFHELWHISPRFDGDLRRHAGRCYAHSHSQAAYEAQFEPLIADYLAQRPVETLPEFLHADFSCLKRTHGRIYGVRIPRPKLIPA